jgi:hypothetical protein
MRRDVTAKVDVDGTVCPTISQIRFVGSDHRGAMKNLDVSTSL